MHGNPTCKIRDLALVACLQIKGFFPIQNTTEDKKGRVQTVFVFPINEKTKQVIDDFHFGRLQVEPRSFSAIYRAIRRSIINAKYGDSNPPAFKEENNGATEQKALPG